MLSVGGGSAEGRIGRWCFCVGFRPYEFFSRVWYPGFPTVQSSLHNYVSFVCSSESSLDALYAPDSALPLLAVVAMLWGWEAARLNPNDHLQSIEADRGVTLVCMLSSRDPTRVDALSNAIHLI